MGARRVLASHVLVLFAGIFWTIGAIVIIYDHWKENGRTLFS